MDAVRFGRWLGERRRARGWASQRALADAARAHPRTRGLNTSEAFLARVEAGLLAHPFRGAVRRRMVALAWLLCGSARQVHDYLKAAELIGLDRAETAEIDSLLRSFTDPRSSRLVILPPPPARLIGRGDDLATLLAALAELRAGCCVISGMAGIGKTCLALAAAHQFATDAQSAEQFADGILFLDCEGRHGVDGACSILEDALAFQQPRDRSNVIHAAATWQPMPGAQSGAAAEGELARLAGRVRRALAGMRVLVLLDGVEPDLPLDHVVGALQPHGFSREPLALEPTEALAAPVLLITSRSLPRLPSLADPWHIHLSPLTSEDGVRMIEQLLGAPLDGEDRKSALRLCTAFGGVPLALVAAVTTVAQTGIPLALLARAAERNPLAAFGGGDTATDAIARSLASLAPETRQHLALLSVLQADSFGLEAAVALRPENPDVALDMAAELSRHSLIEPQRTSIDDSSQHAADDGMPREARFWVPPLVRAYAAAQAQELPPALVESAGHHLVAYAEELVARFNDDSRALEAEAALLRAALSYALRDGEHACAERLVQGLLLVALRHGTCDDIERLVLDGIHAAKAIGDRSSFLHYLNLLGVIRFYEGDTVRARRAWAQCVQLAGDPRTPNRIYGVAHLNLAQLADVEGDPDAAWHLAELGIYYTRKVGITTAIAGALSMQAERARRRGARHVAHKYAREGLELLAAAGSEQPPIHQQPCVVEARLTIARIERDFATATECADQYLALTGTEMRLFAAEALIDQAEYDLEMDANQDARTLAEQALSIAGDAHALGLAWRAQMLRARADQRGTRWYGGAAGA